MKVTQRTVRLELAEPLRISRSTMAARDAVWLTVEDDDGVRGHGEAVTSVYYGLDAGTLERLFADVAAALVRFRDPESALEALRGESAASGSPAAIGRRSALPRPSPPPPRPRSSTSSGSGRAGPCTGFSARRPRRWPRPPGPSASSRRCVPGPRRAGSPRAASRSSR